jgi:hypothetical protein
VSYWDKVFDETLVVEPMHRDRMIAISSPRSWQELVEPNGNRLGAPCEVRVYTVPR